MHRAVVKHQAADELLRLPSDGKDRKDLLVLTVVMVDKAKEAGRKDEKHPMVNEDLNATA